MTYFIVGLGNPEPKYSGTRHNIGREVLDIFAQTHGFSEWERRKEHSALISRGHIGDNEVVLVKPDNYMNNSGASLRKLLSSSDTVENIIVIQDDIDRAIGELHIGFNRGAGGHKGVQSIIDILKTKRFNRIRLGIAPRTFFGSIRKPKGGRAVEKYVIGKFSKNENEKIAPTVEKAAEACALLITEGINKTMNIYN